MFLPNPMSAVGALAGNLNLDRVQLADAQQRFFGNRRFGAFEFVEQFSPCMTLRSLSTCFACGTFGCSVQQAACTMRNVLDLGGPDCRTNAL